MYGIENNNKAEHFAKQNDGNRFYSKIEISKSLVEHDVASVIKCR